MPDSDLTPPDEIALDRQRTWDLFIARWVARLFSPPLVGVIGLFLLAQYLKDPRIWGWTLFYCVFAIVPPVAYILAQLRRGSITDFHMQIRTQRYRPMAIMLVSALVAWVVMWLGSAPPLLLILSAYSVIQAAFLLLVTLRWKISGHATAVAGLAVFLWGTYGPGAAPALLAVPLVAWARIRMKRHNTLQTLAGALTGAGFMLLVLGLIALQCPEEGLPCLSLR